MNFLRLHVFVCPCSSLKRVEETHELSFRRIMANTHLLCAREYSLMFRAQGPTGEDAWKEMMQNDSEMVQVWVEAKGLERKPCLPDPWPPPQSFERGWCKA